MYFPQVADTAPRVEPSGQREAILPTGSETILVVEDELMIREMLCESLEEIGYTVLAAGDATEAIERCRNHGGAIHLLLADVVLPAMGGRELAQELSALRPEMKVVFMSGYTDDAVVRHGVFTSTMRFLQKPFTLIGMARKVREALDAPMTDSAVPAPSGDPGTA